MLPGDSRTSKHHDTFAGLTAGFGFGLGYVIGFIIMLVIGVFICLIAWSL